MENLVVVIGAGQIGQAIARRVAVGKHVVLADRSEANANAAAEVTVAYAMKCSSELCRNCVRSSRNDLRIPTFTGRIESILWRESLIRSRELVFRYHLVSVAGFVFQACSIDHSDISPF